MNTSYVSDKFVLAHCSDCDVNLCVRMIDKGKQPAQHKGAVDNSVKSAVAFCLKM